MKRFFKIVFVALLFISGFATSANAQQAYKGKFESVGNGQRNYTLTLDPYSQSIPTQGTVVFQNDDYEVLSSPKAFNCVGTLVISAPDSQNVYNILSFEEEDDDMPPAFMMIEQFATNPYDENGLIYVGITPGANNDTFSITDTRDLDNPMFTDLKFKRVK